MNPFVNGELTALKTARATAQRAVEAYDAAIAILNSLTTPVKPDPKYAVIERWADHGQEARKTKAVKDYLDGMSSGEVAKKYKVSNVTVRAWVLASGEKMRSAKQAQRLRVARGSSR